MANYKVASINIVGSVLIGKNPVLMNDGTVAQWSGPIDGVLGLFIVVDRDPSD